MGQNDTGPGRDRNGLTWLAAGMSVVPAVIVGIGGVGIADALPSAAWLARRAATTPFPDDALAFYRVFVAIYALKLCLLAVRSVVFGRERLERAARKITGHVPGQQYGDASAASTASLAALTLWLVCLAVVFFLNFPRYSFQPYSFGGFVAEKVIFGGFSILFADAAILGARVVLLQAAVPSER